MNRQLDLPVAGRLHSKCVPICALSLLAALLLIPQAPAFAQDTSHSPGWVVIGVEDYKALRAKAYPPEREPEPPPVEATLSRVDYDLRVNGEFVSGRATLTIDVLKDGWVRVPIPNGLLVREAQLDGKLVSLVSGPQNKGGQLSAVLDHRGRSVLELQIALPIATSAGEESISLPSSVSGVTRAVVEIPKQGMDIRLAGGLLSDRAESAAVSRWTVYATGNQPLTFTWRRKTEDHRAELPLRIRGGLTQLLGLGEDATSVSAEVNLEVVQGLAREIKIQVPSQITINQVLGASVSDWEAKNGQLTVSFLEPVEQAARFVITGEMRLPRDGKIDIPLLRLLGSERETGGAAVEVLGAGEIKDVKTQGLENADASDLGELVANRQSPSLVAFRLRAGDAAQPRSLTIDLARYDQQAVLLANVEEARYRVLINKQGKTLVQARYAVRNNQRNFMKITLPAGATLWSAALGGRPVRPGQAPDGSLLLPLEKSRASEDAPEFAVEITYLTPGTAWSDKGRSALNLPALDLPVSRTGLQIYYPPLFRVTPEPGGPFRTESYVDPTSPVLANGGYGAGVGAGSGGGVAGGAFAMASPTPAPPPTSVVTLNSSAFQAGVGVGAGAAAGLVDSAKAAIDKKDEQATRTLVDKYKSSSTVGRATGILPISVDFPAFGPSVYLVSELTSENQAQSAALSYQQEKKGGVK